MKKAWVKVLEMVTVLGMTVQTAAALGIPASHTTAFLGDNRNDTLADHITAGSTEHSGSWSGWLQPSAYIQVYPVYPTVEFGIGGEQLQGFFHGDLRFRRDPLELSGMNEGDILPHPTPGIKKENGLENKIAVQDSIKLWAGAVVPYEFSFEYNLFPVERLTIHRVMRDIAKHSCIRFVERTDEQDYLKIIVDRDKCYSYVGRVGGVQLLSLGLLCATWLDMGPIYHELLHALGFYHEHNRPDRDHYIEVNWDNIADGSEKNFVKRDVTSVELLDLPYDIDSVMHYSPFTFSKWSILTPTIKSKKKGYNFWRKTAPSKTDYLKLNRLYGCQKARRPRWLGRGGRSRRLYGVEGVIPRQPRRWTRLYQS